MSDRASATATPGQAVIYCRISEDKKGDGLGVERQEAECREYAASRGMTITRVYVDNDLSAKSDDTYRPEFERLLADRPNAVVTWHNDRLLRSSSRTLERVLDTGMMVYAVKAGEFDLSTPTGRALARTVTAWAQNEIELKAERQRAAARQAAEKGLPKWANRPFGFENAGTKGRPAWGLKADEAALIEQAYRDIVRGTTPTEVGRKWAAAGVMPPNGGKRWTGAKVSDILRNRRNAGQSTYKGEVVGVTSYPAIIDLPTFDAVHAILTDPGRPGNRNPRGGQRGGLPTTLLTGIVTCAVCEDGLVRLMGQRRKDGSRRVLYGCHPGHCTADLVWLESAVFAVLTLALDEARDAWPVTDESEAGRRIDALRVELATIDGKLAELAEAYGSDLLTLDQMTAATAKLRAREEAAQAELAGVDATPTLENLLKLGADALIDAWFTFDLGQQRAAISSVFSVIRLHPRGKAGKGKLPRVDFETARPLEGFPWRLVGLADATEDELRRALGSRA